MICFPEEHFTLLYVLHVLLCTDPNVFVKLHYIANKWHVCIVSYLVEQGAVCDGNTEGSEAPAQHHVIRSIVTIATTTTGNEPGHRRPTEHHAAHRKKQIFK